MIRFELQHSRNKNRAKAHLIILRIPVTISPVSGVWAGSYGWAGRYGWTERGRWRVGLATIISAASSCAIASRYRRKEITELANQTSTALVIGITIALASIQGTSWRVCRNVEKIIGRAITAIVCSLRTKPCTARNSFIGNALVAYKAILEAEQKYQNKSVVNNSLCRLKYTHK